MELQIEKLHNQAVNAALARKWDEAIRLNLKVLTFNDENIDALLALSYAYMEKGDLKKARLTYKKALKVDPTNIIARNNSEKIAILLRKGSHDHGSDSGDVVMDPEVFINIKGKTRAVTLINIGQAAILAKLKIGEKVELKIKKRRLEVRNKKGEYIGCLPDDVSKRLIFFIEADTIYDTYIKSSTKNSVDIFIREKSKGTKVEHYISFPDNIQDDMKTFMGKEDDDDEHNADDDTADGHDGDIDGEDEPDMIIDDIEELANDDDDDKVDYYGIDPSDHEDDDIDD